MSRCSLRNLTALVFLAIVLVDFTRQADPDLWGHLLFGQLGFVRLGHESNASQVLP